MVSRSIYIFLHFSIFFFLLVKLIYIFYLYTKARYTRDKRLKLTCHLDNPRYFILCNTPPSPVTESYLSQLYHMIGVSFWYYNKIKKKETKKKPNKQIPKITAKCSTIFDFFAENFKMLKI